MNLNDSEIQNMFNEIKKFSDFIENNPRLFLKSEDKYHLSFDNCQTFVKYFISLPQEYREKYIEEYLLQRDRYSSNSYQKSLLIQGIKIFVWIFNTFAIFEFYGLFNINFRELSYSKFCKQENVIYTLPLQKQKNIYNYYLKKNPNDYEFLR